MSPLGATTTAHASTSGEIWPIISEARSIDTFRGESGTSITKPAAPPSGTSARTAASVSPQNFTKVFIRRLRRRIDGGRLGRRPDSPPARDRCRPGSHPRLGPRIVGPVRGPSLHSSRGGGDVHRPPPKFRRPRPVASGGYRG